MSPRALRIATRGSPLALWQAERVATLLGGDTEIVIIKTEGDRRTDVPLEDLAGRGVFTTEVQEAVLDGRADVAVHSAKDLPSSAELQVDGLVLACVPERADARDCLIGSTIDALPHGATVGTGSTRRQALLAHLRPDLHFAGLRGNIATRMARVGELDAIVGAVAALTRLGLAEQIAEALPTDTFVPQVGQGALAVECRSEDNETLERLNVIDDDDAHRAVLAERSFLATLGGGCDAPVGAHATIFEGEIRLMGFLSTELGPSWQSGIGVDPAVVGPEVAKTLRRQANA